MTVHAQTVPVCNHFGDCFTAFFKKVFGIFTAYDRALYAHNTFERLFSMSDQELAEFGIKRDDIPQLITRKMGWSKE
ncbi:MAG: hypothetical protein OEY85_09070 [Rhodospirillales bacterium]|nr:hypothetical protein [Rhodospirillales bacterium]